MKPSLIFKALQFLDTMGRIVLIFPSQQNGVSDLSWLS